MHRVTDYHYFYPRTGEFWSGCWMENENGLKKKTSKGSDPAQHLKHLKHPRQHWRPPVCGDVIPQASVRERRRTERLPVRLDGCCLTWSISISPPQTAQGWRCVNPSPLHPSFFSLSCRSQPVLFISHTLSKWSVREALSVLFIKLRLNRRSSAVWILPDIRRGFINNMCVRWNRGCELRANLVPDPDLRYACL